MITTKRPFQTIHGLLLTAVLLSMVGCGGADARKARYVAKGQELMAAHSYEKARLEFRNALQIDPKDTAARLLAGEVAEKLGNYSEAAQMYQAAIAADGKSVAARAHLGRILVIGGLPDKALEVIDPGLKIAAEDPGLLTVRAAVRMQQGDLAAARKDAEQAVALAPTNQDAMAVLAALMRRDGQVAEAIALLQKGVKASPGSVDLRLVLAQMLLDQQQVPSAEQQLKEIIRLEPDKMVHRYRLAQLYLFGKNVDGAEAVMRDAVASQPDSVEAQLGLAYLLAAHRSFEVADKQVESARSKRPDDMPLQLGIGEFYERQDKAAQAEQVYRDVIAKDEAGPQGLTARNRIAAMKLRAGKPAEAAKLVDEVLDKNPRDADALVMRADLALAKGDTNAAVADLRAVLRDQPNSIPIQRALARAHLQAGDVTLAEETLRTAVQSNPRDLGARLDLAQLLLRQGKPKEATPVLEQLVADEPNNIAALEALYRVQGAGKDLPAALKTAKTIQALQPKLPLGFYLEGMVEQAQQHPAEARAAFEHAAALDPKALDPVVELAQLDVAEKQTERALARIDEYLVGQPQNAVAQNLKGELLLAANRAPEASTSFAAALALNSQGWQPYRGQARAALAQGKTDAAIAAYTSGIAATQGSPLLAAELAGLYEQLGRNDEAIAEYEGMLKRDPANDIAANNLAMLLVTYRKDAASLARAGQLAERFAQSPNPAFLDTYGWVLYARGQYAASITPLKAAADKVPNAQVLRYHLGMAQLKVGEREAARTNLEAAVANNARYAGVEEARAALVNLKKSGT